MSRHLLVWLHVVHVADPRRVQLIAKDPRKTDRRDAELLARLEHGMPGLLGRVHHRGEQAQADLAMIGPGTRSGCGPVPPSCSASGGWPDQSFGLRLPSASTKGFGKKVRGLVPQILLPAVEPLLDQIVALSATIRTYDRCIGRPPRSATPRPPCCSRSTASDR
ncbi:MAG: hypothetical protein R3F30_00515 [Planctomycetota bacterium]